MNLRTVIFEDTEKGLFQSLKQHKTGPIFSLSLSTSGSFYTDLSIVSTFSVSRMLLLVSEVDVIGLEGKAAVS